MRSEADRLRELLAITRVITGSSTHEEALQLVARKARELTGAEASLLLMAEPGSPASIVASDGTVPERVRALEPVLDERLVERLRRSFRLDPDDTVLAVPMILRGDVRGSLVVLERRRGRPPQQPALRDENEFLLSALADQAAVALGQSAERHWLKAVIACSPVAVLLVDRAAGGRVTANVRAELLFGRRIVPEEGVTQLAGQVCTPEGEPLPPAEVPALRALRGELVDRELAIRHLDGTLTPVLANTAAIRDEQGKVLGAAVLYQDISVLKDLQRLREEWTSVVAHDLRQPVQVIALAAKVLGRRAEAGSPSARDAEVIHTSALHLQRMIDDLLLSSLVDTRHLSLDRRPCELGTLLADIADRFTGTPVALEVPEELPPVEVDRGRIEQVLANLLTNASKYGEPGTPIEVGARQDGDAVEITVRNQGPGIDPEKIETVFERFQRGQKLGPPGEGLGLGLFICKGLVEAHGGRIWVDSVPGRSTTFHFTLPVAPLLSPAV